MLKQIIIFTIGEYYKRGKERMVYTVPSFFLIFVILKDVLDFSRKDIFWHKITQEIKLRPSEKFLCFYYAEKDTGNF